jgi:hypothetical protein
MIIKVKIINREEIRIFISNMKFIICTKKWLYYCISHDSCGIYSYNIWNKREYQNDNKN